ncbi:hypothetical protein V6N13_092374 [Hibiscus sabdariffa]
MPTLGNPLANIFFVENDNAANHCMPSGNPCYSDYMCCSANCAGLSQAHKGHGDVMDAFIARKISRGGKRSGFVRYARMSDAERAVERLNGFALYGTKIFVTFAKFKTRQSFWRKVRPEPTLNSKLEEHVSRNKFEEDDRRT